MLKISAWAMPWTANMQKLNVLDNYVIMLISITNLNL